MSNKYQCEHCGGTGEAAEATGKDLGIMGNVLTDFDVWWCDQIIGNLDTKDTCKRQWVSMEQAGMDCSDITKVMDETWSAEFGKREAAMKDLTDLGQTFDASTDSTKEPNA